MCFGVTARDVRVDSVLGSAGCLLLLLAASASARRFGLCTEQGHTSLTVRVITQSPACS